MGDKYNAPKIEKLSNAVEEQVAQEAKLDTSLKVLTEKVPTDAVGIYQQGITAFKDFLAGNFEGNLETRKKFQRDFIRGLWNILELTDVQVKAILDHFVITIAENPQTFDYNNIIAPLFAIESDMPSEEATRYKRFMLFMTMYAEHARDRKRFLEKYDMVKFENMFNPVAKQRLHNYVYG